MRFIRSAATTLMLAGAATLAVSAVPCLTTSAFAGVPPANVSPMVATPGTLVTFTITCKRAQHAWLDASMLGLGQRIPMHPGPQPHEWVKDESVPQTISPGTYSASLTCDHRGYSATVSLTVNAEITPVVDVSPSMASPGDRVRFAITCGPMATGATLYGAVLGLGQQIPMQPGRHPNRWVTTVNLPQSITPGNYTPSIDCEPNGPSATAPLTVNPQATPVVHVSPSVASPGDSVTFAITCGPMATGATLYGTTLGLTEQIPMDPGPQPNQWVATVTLPQSITPGNYTPSVDCEPNGPSATASLTVNPVGPPVPIGPPVTGDGATSSVLGGPFTTAGLALLGAGGLAVVAGVVRRRRSGARS